MEEMIFAAEAALLLKVSVKTLQRWDREKKLVANRTATGRRWYTKAQLEMFQHGSKPSTPPAATSTPIVAQPVVTTNAIPPAVLAPIAAPEVITDPSHPEYIPLSEEEQL